MQSSPYAWWQTGVIYQIYPRSFSDSNHDGIGDLQGIIDRLDYLVALGIDAIWISPIYPSPMADFGYDVADYTDIHPMFGTLDIFDRLVAEAHRRNLRVVLDYVPNHTSDQHPWFLESRSSRDNPRRNWYLWRDPRPDGGLPNNWASMFGGPAWTWDETTRQNYLHLFLAEQPDLNWRNPATKAAMLEVLRFWLDRGVDGFRMDVIGFIIKDEALRDNPPVVPPKPLKPDDLWPGQHHVYDIDLPDVHDIIREIRALVDTYPDRVTIGEVWAEPRSRWVEYYGSTLNGLHLPFNFSLLRLPWRAETFRASVDELEAALPPGAWPNYVLGNHDISRLASRFGEHTIRVAAMLLLTLRGTPTLYMGDELGMTDGVIPPDRIQDPPALKIGPEQGRDPCRTPFQWSPARHAGFSSVEPWLPVAEGYEERNVALQEHNPRSVLSLYRELLRYRRVTPALHIGSYTPLDVDAENCFVYLREADGQRRLVALNFANEERQLSLTSLASRGYRVISTELDPPQPVDLARVVLRPNEGIIVEV